MFLSKDADGHCPVQISGYTLLEEIYNGTKTAVYRAVDTEQRPVVIKVLQEKYPSFNDLVQFQNQYTIAVDLNIPGIIRPYSLDLLGNGYMLVMEDFGGISVQEYVQTRSLDLVEVLVLALQITEVLEALYQHRIVHKDIKPANVLIHPESKQIKLIDFSIATLLPKETQDIQNPNRLEGTLAYLAPEQTGRMNRGIDYRADFYALGVMLYELLTGSLPFDSSDPLELVHCHMAKSPMPIQALNENVPDVLAAIVHKLMAKNAEDRYQSATGLKHDLAQCLTQWKDNGAIALFEIGAYDLSDRFIIPEKLYGRTDEVDRLLSAFERVGAGQCELMLVAGFSGIGKTAVVNEVHKPITRQQGYFVKGKFDQFNRSLPFSAFIQSLRALMRQILSESDAQLAQWRERVLSVLGENGQVIVDVVPELSLLIGQQPPAPELASSESQNRFHRLLEQFIQVFATQSHPLVVFLDDLQWADLASLDLIAQLMQQESGHLLLLGAYRDNEVSAAHPLMLMVDRLSQADRSLETITLLPLSEANINQLTADTLKCPSAAATPLSQLVYQKAQGNPFFSTQLLKSLHADGWIEFNSVSRGWQCDLSRLKSEVISDDVVALMTQQLQKLSSECQHLLQIAACIGNQFDLATLATVCEKPVFETATVLWPALEAGFIFPQNETYKFFQAADNMAEPSQAEIVASPLEKAKIADSAQALNYKFLHDRIQQAAYALIAEDQRQRVHLNIGQRLLVTTSAAEQAERLFEIVNHLNVSHMLLPAAEQLKLAQLNLQAGQKAKVSTAYAAAVDYFRSGIALLPPEAWQQHYRLMLSLHTEAAEAAYLSTDFDGMETWAQVALEQAQSLLDTISVQKTRLFGKKAQGELLASLQIGRQVLASLGISFPENPTQADIGQSFGVTRQLWAEQSPLSLLDLPAMSEPNHLAAMDILSIMVAPAYMAAPSLMPLLIFKQVELSIEHGNCPTSIYAYADYGLILCGVIGDIASGYDFGQLALNLLDRLQAKAFTCRGVFIVHTYINHWKKPLQLAIPQLQKAYQSGLETGDIEIGSLSAAVYCYYSYHAGKTLLNLSKEMAAYHAAISQLKQTTPQYYVEIYRQTVLNLLEQSDVPQQLTGSVFNAIESLPILQKMNSRTALFYYYFNQMILSYLFGEYDKAADASCLAEQHLDGGTGTFMVPMYSAYDALVQLALLKETSEDAAAESFANEAAAAEAAELLRQERLARVKQSQEQLKNWVAFAPCNHQHRWELVEAERYAQQGDRLAAMEAYDQAIAAAKANRYIQEEALGNELAAKFYLDWGRDKLAEVYMQEAYYCYAHWGAKAKITHLEQQYSSLLKPILQKAKQPALAHLSTTSTIVSTNLAVSPTSSLHADSGTGQASRTFINPELDFASVIKASQALSGTMQLDELIAQLTQIILQNSGGDRCALILANSNKVWQVRAVATTKSVDLCNEPIADNPNLPNKLIHYVKNTQETVVVDNLDTSLPVIDDYLIQQQPKSLLCLPILNQGKLFGLLYLRNQSVSGVFKDNHIMILNFLCTQAAISLENSRLYQQAQDHAQQIEQSHIQTVQNEKKPSF
ncbi:MAG: AAA family ATPase, partial [Cyanobacteria bacterium J06560_2]